jgi:hypothetical protein
MPVNYQLLLFLFVALCSLHDGDYVELNRSDERRIKVE